MTDKKESKIEIRHDSSDLELIKKQLELLKKQKEELEKKKGQK
ncbi:MAG TPA: hypothetical protein PLX69_21515 [Leptospiraceae bacterium]|nr:hypothetical protein [Leptospiraceae bacterium]